MCEGETGIRSWLRDSHIRGPFGYGGVLNLAPGTLHRLPVSLAIGQLDGGLRRIEPYALDWAGSLASHAGHDRSVPEGNPSIQAGARRESVLRHGAPRHYRKQQEENPKSS
jgi:hypothetical protein